MPYSTVFSLAPKASRKSLFQINSTAVKITEIVICIAKQVPKIFSADSLSPLPIEIDALGAPPFPTNAANADTIKISGIQTPTPVRANAPTLGICPM